MRKKLGAERIEDIVLAHWRERFGASRRPCRGGVDQMSTLTA